MQIYIKSNCVPAPDLPLTQKEIPPRAITTITTIFIPSLTVQTAVLRSRDRRPRASPTGLGAVIETLAEAGVAGDTGVFPIKGEGKRSQLLCNLFWGAM